MLLKVNYVYDSLFLKCPCIITITLPVSFWLLPWRKTVWLYLYQVNLMILWPPLLESLPVHSLQCQCELWHVHWTWVYRDCIFSLISSRFLGLPESQPLFKVGYINLNLDEVMWPLNWKIFPHLMNFIYNRHHQYIWLSEAGIKYLQSFVWKYDILSTKLLELKLVHIWALVMCSCNHMHEHNPKPLFSIYIWTWFMAS